MFKITDRGFHITFENGYTVSVQFGEYTYCDKYPFNKKDSEREESPDAECAVIKDGILLQHFEEGSVKGWMKPKEVLDLLIWAESQEES